MNNNDIKTIIWALIPIVNLPLLLKLTFLQSILLGIKVVVFFATILLFYRIIEFLDFKFLDIAKKQIEKKRKIQGKLGDQKVIES